MRKPLLLDLFCGAGGAAVGYHRAGFDVLGVDVAEQPHYPFLRVKADALSVLDNYPMRFDAIHASPPCQRYSAVTGVSGDRDEHPDLIGPVRERLVSIGLPYVIENVEGAPLHDPIRLCGTAFDGLRVIRHRLFESNVALEGVGCRDHPLLYVPDARRAHQGELDEWRDFVLVTGGGNCSKAAAADALGIDWPMFKRELNEVIPPAYTEFVGRQLKEAL